MQRLVGHLPYNRRGGETCCSVRACVTDTSVSLNTPRTIDGEGETCCSVRAEFFGQQRLVEHLPYNRREGETSWGAQVSTQFCLIRPYNRRGGIDHTRLPSVIAFDRASRAIDGEAHNAALSTATSAPASRTIDEEGRAVGVNIGGGAGEAVPAKLC